MLVTRHRFVRIGLTEAEAFQLGTWLEENTTKFDDEVIDQIYDELDKLGYVLESGLDEKKDD